MRERDTERIVRRCWVHSHEEDSDEEMVFRPAAYEFPPSRGRRSFELKPDGIPPYGDAGYVGAQGRPPPSPPGPFRDAPHHADSFGGRPVGCRKIV